MEFHFSVPAAPVRTAPPREGAPEAGMEAKEPGGFRALLDRRQQELSGEAGERTETEAPLTGQRPEPGADGEKDRLALGAQMLLAALSAAQVSVEPAVERPGQEPGGAPALLTPAEPAAGTVVQPQPNDPAAGSAPQGQPLQAGPEMESPAPQVRTPEPGGAERQGPAAVAERPGPARSGPATPERRAGDAPDMPAAPEPEAPLFRGVEAAPVKVGSGPELPPEAAAVPVERQVLRRLETAVELGETRVRISLEPESLGGVTVELTRGEDGLLRVLLHAESPKTQSLLERSAAGLQSLLSESARGAVQVQVEREQENQQSRQNLYDQGGRGGQPQQEQSRQRRHQPDEAFLQQLRLGLIPLAPEAS